MMVRTFGCVLATLSCGCLMPNPAYVGGGSGSGGESASSEASSSQGDTTVAGEGATTTTGPSATETGSSSSGAGSDEACPAEDTLAVCLLFDVDEPADVVDESSYANPITIVGGGLVDSPWARAFAFDDGTQLRVACPQACLGGEQVSFEAWVRVDEVPVVRSGVIDHNGLLGAFVTEALSLRCNSQGGAAEGGEIVLRSWTHVACVADGDTLVAYVNGEGVAQRSINPLTPVGQPTVVVGNDSPSYGEPLIGALDRVRVWDTALSAAQVAEAATP